jgi:hypothetical protein
MPTECSPTLFEFAPAEGRRVVAGFDGGAITSDAGALLLGQAGRAIGLIDRFAACFNDARTAELVEHQVGTMVMQRVFGIALGYEDLNDHDELRGDPVMAVLAGKLAARRADCAPLAGKSTLNRLELSRPEPTRYHKISHDPAAIETLFVDVFLQCTGGHRRRSSSTWPPPTIRCTGTRKAASSTAITTATATFRSTCFVAGICWRPSYGARMSTHRLGQWRRLRALWRRSAAAGRVCAFCCAAIPALPARR